MNQLGYDVTGVDLSKQSIDTANTHSNDRLKFSVHDMRKPMKSKFDVVLNMITSFGYFDTLEEDLMVIMAIKKSLKAWLNVIIAVKVRASPFKTFFIEAM